MSESLQQDNLAIYQIAKIVPDEAKSTIKGGRLKGYTDIKPQYRFKKMTELFGPVGQGWKVSEPEFWERSHGSTTMLFCKCFVKYWIEERGEWSEPLWGYGGNPLIAEETNGIHFDDEAYKKCYTDAFGKAVQALGVGADVYWQNDTTKYTSSAEPVPRQAGENRQDLIGKFKEACLKAGMREDDIVASYKANSVEDISSDNLVKAIKALGIKAAKLEKEMQDSAILVKQEIEEKKAAKSKAELALENAGIPIEPFLDEASEELAQIEADSLLYEKA